MVDTLPSPFGEEIKGIATVSGVPLGKKQLLQVAAVCKNIPFYMFIYVFLI